jgi:molybdenum cofactor biosynthesis protein A
MLVDKFGRQIKYLRLSVTDRCNLRCFYCMPEHGINYLPREQLLTYEELLHLADLLISEGITKIRITGGEPFARKDLMHFLCKLVENSALERVSITTNGILTQPYLAELKKLGIDHINLSLDTLDRENFRRIARRDEFEKVMNTFNQMLDLGIKVKINAVIMDGINDHEIVPLASLARDYPVAVRFIEEMPFNGEVKSTKALKWNYLAILKELQASFPDLHEVPTPNNSTCQSYRFEGAKGELGIIAAFSRTFCGTCDRIRITSTGALRTCLYGHNILDMKHLIRSAKSDGEILSALRRVISERAKDGFEAERISGAEEQTNESMSVIGG